MERKGRRPNGTEKVVSTRAWMRPIQSSFNVLSLLQQDTRNDECLVLGAEASLLPLLIPGLFLLDPFSSI